MERNKLIGELKEYFSQKEEVLLAFLFGSYSKGKVLSESDIDIAVWLKKGYSLEKVNRLWGEIEDLVKHAVDLVVLNRAFSTIAWTAIRGIPLLIRDYYFYLRYMLEISGEAEDFQDFLIDLWRWRERIRKARSIENGSLK
jgi:predicted nucleotidyltransferase